MLNKRQIMLDELRTVMTDADNVKPDNFTREAAEFLLGLAQGTIDKLNANCDKGEQWMVEEITGLLGLVFVRGFEAGQSDIMDEWRNEQELIDC